MEKASAALYDQAVDLMAKILESLVNYRSEEICKILEALSQINNEQDLLWSFDEFYEKLRLNNLD